MRASLFIILFVAMCITHEVQAQSSYDVPVFDYEEFAEYMEGYDDSKTLVVNFWATWCMPCVKELPYFEEAHAYYDGTDVEVILVSLDFDTHLDSRVIPFLEKNKIKSTVVLLDDPDANAWIDKVSPEWSGAIPATLVVRGTKRAFYEQSFHSFGEIQHIIQPFIKS